MHCLKGALIARTKSFCATSSSPQSSSDILALCLAELATSCHGSFLSYPARRMAARFRCSVLPQPCCPAFSCSVVNVLLTCTILSRSGAAAIARRVYLRQGLGVGALRRSFGNRNTTRGTHPEKHGDAAGGIIRHIMKQFEANNLMEKTTTMKGGRKLTPSGQRDLDLIAGRIAAAMAEETAE